MLVKPTLEGCAESGVILQVAPNSREVDKNRNSCLVKESLGADSTSL